MSVRAFYGRVITILQMGNRGSEKLDFHVIKLLRIFKSRKFQVFSHYITLYSLFVFLYRLFSLTLVKYEILELGWQFFFKTQGLGSVEYYSTLYSVKELLPPMLLFWQLFL